MPPEPYLVRYIDYLKPDSCDLLDEIWEKLVADRLWRALFYDGSVTDFSSFRKEIGRPGCLPFAVYGMGRLAMFSWLNNLQNRTARSHFVVFREFWGRAKRLRLGRFLYDYILTRRDDDGYILDCLYGITPATYQLAIRAVLASGWVRCGVIPNVCYMADVNEHVDGVITCATREILGCQ